MIINNVIDMTDTMYPTRASKVCNDWFTTDTCATTYGYVLTGTAVFPNGNTAKKGQYFSYWSATSESLAIEGEAVFISRIGFKGQNNIGGPLEESGRLCYIDNCSDSLLIYPPRLGDPSLSALYFPTGTNQTFHIHPSIRIGVVVFGSGFSCLKNDDSEQEMPLKAGDMFCIEEREVHRFKTTDSKMVVIAFHPDGDWGPTDHNHTMLNRTYITK
jgi:hypothetical protein